MYRNLSKAECEQLYRTELDIYRDYQSRNLKLDMSRGKPCKEQLDLSMGLLDVLTSKSNVIGAQDYRNYGFLDGIPEIKKIFCDLTGVTEKEIIVAGNASLNMMYDSVQRGMQYGWSGMPPMNRQGKLKWLCPVPGYDRHFGVTEAFGFEMINISMTENGPDMDMVEEYVKDPTVKGIWCVPKYSNPEGVVYSDDTVRRFATLKPAAPDFRIYWDNAYMIHSLTEEGDHLLDLFAEAKKAGNEDIVYMFGSTSKVSFAGAGVAFMCASEGNIAEAKKRMGVQTIGYDKLNQLAHARFFGNAENMIAHMDKHRAILAPKFQLVIDILEKELLPTGIIEFKKPRGGYFVSVNLEEGTAKRTVQLAKECGVVFTGAGATYPYKRDPKDSNLRIAPSLPPMEELKTAMEVFCCAAKIAYLEKVLEK